MHSLRFVSLDKQRAEADKANALAVRAYDIAMRGYRAGLTNYLEVLNAQNQTLVESLRRAKIEARKLDAHRPVDAGPRWRIGLRYLQRQLRRRVQRYGHAGFRQKPTGGQTMKNTSRSQRLVNLFALAKGIAAETGREAATWLFALKQTLAVLLAMWISMRFELGQPGTAMVTVYVLMHPQSGMVLTKSVYRILGTLSGAVACLVLFALFPQERVLFLLGLSLWVGFCTAGAALNRNFRCYGFTLAGYTAAMIGLAQANHPMSFFTYGQQSNFRGSGWNPLCRFGW